MGRRRITEDLFSSVSAMTEQEFLILRLIIRVPDVTHQTIARELGISVKRSRNLCSGNPVLRLFKSKEYTK